MPALSVIVPAHNRARFIEACVRSILESGIDCEIVVVDDGSTDGTAGIVRHLGPRVKYLYQDNAGPAAARNTGFRASCGRYVSFLDSDDQWVPGGMSRLLCVLDQHPAVSVAFGDARQIHGDHDQPRSFIDIQGGIDPLCIPALALEPGVHQLTLQHFFRQMVRRNRVFLGSLVVRRDAFERTGGFNPALRGTEDWELCLRLAHRFQFAFCAATPVSIYVKHEGGLSTDRDGMALGFIKALVRLLEEPSLSPGDRRFVEDRLREHRFGWAYRAYDRGETAIARERFLGCVRLSRLGGRAFSYWLACHLRPEHVRSLRAFKRALAGVFARAAVQREAQV